MPVFRKNYSGQYIDAPVDSMNGRFNFPDTIESKNKSIAQYIVQ